MVLQYQEAALTGIISASSKKIFYPELSSKFLLYGGIETIVANLMSQALKGYIKMPQLITRLRSAGSVDVVGGILSGIFQQFLSTGFPRLDMMTVHRFIINFLIYIGSDGLATGLLQPSVVQSLQNSISSVSGSVGLSKGPVGSIMPVESGYVDSVQGSAGFPGRDGSYVNPFY